MTATTRERLELIIRTDAEGAHSAGVEFATLAAAKRYLAVVWDAINGKPTAREQLAGTDWSLVTNAWIAGVDTGTVYCE